MKIAAYVTREAEHLYIAHANVAGMSMHGTGASEQEALDNLAFAVLDCRLPKFIELDLQSYVVRRKGVRA